MIHLTSTRQEQFGYYRVGTMKFFSKLEAIEMETKTNLPLSWHFNDEVYSSYDWSLEPPESLEELYRKRAQQIRDKYDYLVLWYSGGADSDNILDTFIDNDIKLDEVVSLVNYEATSNKFNELNGEIFNIAIPKIQKIQEKYPDLKHRVIDLTQYMVEYFSESVMKFDWIYKMNSLFTPSHSTKSQLRSKIPDWLDMFAQGKKVGFIHGIDKARLKVKDNKYSFNFNDSIDIAVSPDSQMKNEPHIFDELFYWTKDYPEIVIKQSHVLKRAVMNLDIKPDMLQNPRSGVGRPPVGACQVQIYYGSHPTEFNWLIPDSINRLIYPNWSPIPYQFKSPSIFFLNRDTWFFEQGQESSKYNWRTGLDELWKKVPNKYKTNPNDMNRDFRWFNSKEYYL